MLAAFSLSSCSTLTDLASGGIDNAADSFGVSGRASGVIKKAVMPKEKEWDDGDDSFREDVAGSFPKSQAYLDAILNNMLSYAEVKDEEFSIYVLRTARVQGLASQGIDIFGTEVRITRGMFNMIYDEAETACLTGHEIGHVVLHRAQEKEKPLISNEDKTEAASAMTDIILGDSKYKGIVKRQQDKILKTNWSRDEEKEADKYGAELAAKAGYDPYALCNLFERLASRVDSDFIYRLNKLEGSHPALDDRAKSLREYLDKKGYKEGEGKRNREKYLIGMSDLFGMRTGEGEKESKKIQKEADAQGKKDLKRLDEIFKEAEGLKKANKSISMKRFIEIMDEISGICKKYDVTADDIFGIAVSADGNSFMEESIVQDSPFWEIFKSVKDAVAGKVGNILNLLGRVAIGSMPVIGDVIDAYELISGKDFFTGEKLTSLERAMSAFGLLAGSAAAWRKIAQSLDNELAGFANRIHAVDITEARTMLKNAIKDVEVSGDWKRIYSKTANKDFPFDSLPYRKGMSVYEGVLKNNEVFYRVYSDSIKGQRLIKFNPGEMSSRELQNILSLPKLPTSIAKVNVPAGTGIRVGNVGEVLSKRKEWGNGGATQWQIITNEKTFDELGIVFENFGKIK